MLFLITHSLGFYVFNLEDGPGTYFLQHNHQFSIISKYQFSFVSTWIAMKVLEIQLHKTTLSLFPRQLVLGDHGTQLSCLSSSSSGVFLTSTEVRQRDKDEDIPTDMEIGSRSLKNSLLSLSQGTRAGANPQWGAQRRGKPSLLPSWQPGEAGQEPWQHGKGRRKTAGGV